MTGDGVLDIVSGAWWYEGPDYRKRHRIGQVRQEGEYYDDFSTIPMDVNGDGFTGTTFAKHAIDDFVWLGDDELLYASGNAVYRVKADGTDRRKVFPP